MAAISTHILEGQNTIVFNRETLKNLFESYLNLHVMNVGADGVGKVNVTAIEVDYDADLSRKSERAISSNGDFRLLVTFSPMQS